MTTYRGVRGPGGTVVTADNQPLEPRHDLRNLSTVFEWGYVGSGPTQLALALLAHHRGAEEALKLYKEFAEAIIAEIKHDEWTLSGDAIDSGIENMAPVPMDLNELLRRARRGYQPS